MTGILDPMDRAIAPEKIRKRKILSAVILGAVAIGIAVTWYGGYNYIKPELKHSMIKTAKVERKDIFSSIPATGVVEAEHMNTLLAPFSGKILHIKRPSGSSVQKGDTILILDQALVKEQLENLQDQLALSQNSYRQSLLSVENQKLEIDYQLEEKKMRIANLEASISEENQLLAVGGISEEKIRATKQELNLAKRDLDLAVKQNKIRTDKTKAEQEGLDLAAKIKKRELEKGRKLFDAAYVIAPENGIVVSISGREGQTISSGQEMVSLSDLTTFKLTGKISDSNAEKIHSNGKVIAINDDIRLEGTIGNIRPEVEAGMVKFDVFLKQNDHPSLRPNLNVELQVVTDEKNRTLCLPDGPFFTGEKELEVFRITGNTAFRTTVKTGLNNFEQVEITDGLAEGDEVVVSDVSKVIHLETIKIKP